MGGTQNLENAKEQNFVEQSKTALQGLSSTEAVKVDFDGTNKLKEKVKAHKQTDEFKIASIKEDMKNESFYNDVLSSYIDKTYKKELHDSDFIHYLKKEAKVDEKTKQTITNYISKGLEPGKNTSFSSDVLNDVFNKNYNKLDMSSLKIDVSGLEKQYKSGILLNRINDLIDKESNIYMLNNIGSNYVDQIKDEYAKKIDGLSLDDVRNYYPLENAVLGRSFLKAYKNYIHESVTEILVKANREFILQQFSLSNNEQKYTDEQLNQEFIDALNNKQTSAEAINNLAYILRVYGDRNSDNYDGSSSTIHTKRREVFDHILNSLGTRDVTYFRKIEIKYGEYEEYSMLDWMKNPTTGPGGADGGISLQFPKSEQGSTSVSDILNTYSMLTSSIGNTAITYVDDLSPGTFRIIPQADRVSPSHGTYRDVLDTKNTTELSLEEKNNLEGDLKKLAEDADTISIQIPSGNANIEKQIYEIINQDIFKDLSHPITVERVDNLKSVNVEYTESQEEFGIFHAKIDNLPYNELGTWEDVKNILDKNPDIYPFLNDPNYKITNMSAYGSASFETTTQSSRSHLQKYKNMDNIKINNQNADKQIVEQKDGGIYTKNPSLAYDRAASLVDCFYNVNKMMDDTKVNISYGVNGPTREDLVKQGKNSEEMKAEFTKYQYAEIDIDYKKNTTNRGSAKSFNLDSKKTYVGLRVASD